MFTTSVAAVLALAFVGTANAHMVMSKPQPPNFNQLSNAPIHIETFQFPCHTGGDSGYTMDDPSYQAPTAQAGSSMEVAFTGSAVHGGGTCQFSVNYGDTPSANPSDWKVIHTIEGGCPADAEGNLIETGATDGFGHATGNACDPSQKSTGMECVRSFDIPIPKDIKNGKATFAWTWFNKIGNREMYMNCAPIEITGGADDNTGVDKLPSIFFANYGSEGSCTTQQGGPLQLPAALAGQSVINNLGSALSSAADGLGCADKQVDGKVGGNGGDASTPSPVVPAPAPVTTPPTNTGYGVLAPSASPAPSSAPSSVVENPPSVPSQTASPVESGPEPSGNGVPCSTDGAIVCMGDNQWGLCDHGMAIPQALAAGTVCEGTAIQAIATRKRHIGRHLRLHPRSFR